MSGDNKLRVIRDDFLNQFINGPLKLLISVIANECSGLALCFRKEYKKNREYDYVSIYYKGHQLFKVTNQVNQIKAEFNFNHAKFSDDWEDMLERLCGMGFFLNIPKSELKPDDGRSLVEILRSRKFGTQKPEPKSGTSELRLVIDKKNADCSIAWHDAIKDIKKLMCDFLGQNNPKNYQEKNDQLEIMLRNRNFENGYVFYDLEYQLPRTSSKTEKIIGQIDLMGIHFKNGKPVALALTELKSTQEAVENPKTGVEAHYEAMVKYLEDDEFIPKRGIEAHSAMTNLMNIGLMEVRPLDVEDFKLLSPEILFLFTCKAKENSSVKENFKRAHDEDVICLDLDSDLVIP
jgi:hypothetical protein